jgi:hypothetical protein
MREARFTQGPWGLSKRCGSERVVIAEELDDDGEYYGDIPICFVTCQCVDINEAYANARLIAAAPEMLRLLEKLYALANIDIMGKVYSPDHEINIDELAAVIAKAKGEDVPSPVFQSVVDLEVEEVEGEEQSRERHE